MHRRSAALKLLRAGAPLTLTVGMEPLSAPEHAEHNGRVVLWAGAVLQRPPAAVSRQRGICDAGVYIASIASGSPARTVTFRSAAAPRTSHRPYLPPTAWPATARLCRPTDASIRLVDGFNSGRAGQSLRGAADVDGAGSGRRAHALGGRIPRPGSRCKSQTTLQALTGHPRRSGPTVSSRVVQLVCCPQTEWPTRRVVRCTMNVGMLRGVIAGGAEEGRGGCACEARQPSGQDRCVHLAHGPPVLADRNSTGAAAEQQLTERRQQPSQPGHCRGPGWGFCCCARTTEAIGGIQQWFSLAVVAMGWV